MKPFSKNSNLGADFESEIESFLGVYKIQGLALIEKLEVKKATINGKTIYLEDSPFDFMGAIKPKIPIAFECKTKKSVNAKTAKFKMLTDQDLLLSKRKKTGTFDEETRKALRALVGSENLEERWDGSGESIDRMALDYLRDRFK